MAVQGQASEEAIRTQVHGMWAAVAPRWGEHPEVGDARVAAVTTAMVGRTALRPGQRVLELACGPGGAGLAAAEVVGPDGEVVVSDVVAEMAALAGARAVAGGLANVRTAVLDLEDIDQPDGAYDVVVCREGLMFAVEPARALAEVHRVLRPGGRMAVSVWGARSANPWLGLVFDAVSAETGTPVPPPGVPGPFALDDPVRLGALVAGAGFADVVVESIAVPLRSPSFEAWWDRTTTLAGPLAAVLARLPEASRAGIVEGLRAATSPFTTPTGLELPGEALLASGRRL